MLTTGGRILWYFRQFPKAIFSRIISTCSDFCLTVRYIVIESNTSKLQLVSLLVQRSMEHSEVLWLHMIALCPHVRNKLCCFIMFQWNLQVWVHFLRDFTDFALYTRFFTPGFLREILTKQPYFRWVNSCDLSKMQVWSPHWCLLTVSTYLSSQPLQIKRTMLAASLRVRVNLAATQYPRGSYLYFSHLLLVILKHAIKKSIPSASFRFLGVRARASLQRQGAPKKKDLASENCTAGWWFGTCYISHIYIIYIIYIYI